jgi:hypothetical protein
MAINIHELDMFFPPVSFYSDRERKWLKEKPSGKYFKAELFLSVALLTDGMPETTWRSSVCANTTNKSI